jgi:hypothetical protein
MVIVPTDADGSMTALLTPVSAMKKVSLFSGVVSPLTSTISG